MLAPPLPHTENSHILLLLLLWLWCYCGTRSCSVFYCFYIDVVVALYVSTPLPHTENSVFRRFCHKPPSPRRRTLFVGKRQYKKTVKLIIFHPRAGRPGGIRASDLEAPYQNCLVVQRAAKRPFGPPSSPAGSRIWAPLCQHPPSPTPPLILTSFAG